MTMQIGMQLPSLVFRLATGAENAFSVRWKDEDGVGLDLTSTTVRLVVDDGGTYWSTFDATNSAGGYSNWSIPALQAVPELVGRPVRLEFLIGGVTYLMASGRVKAA